MAVAGTVLLIDWGLAVARGGAARARGVPAFAPRSAFEQDAYAAQPAQDALGALLTWLAVAYDAGCAAPWLAAPAEDDSAVFAARDAWLRDGARRDADATLQRVAEAVEALGAARQPRHGATAHEAGNQLWQRCMADPELREMMHDASHRD